MHEHARKNEGIETNSRACLADRIAFDECHVLSP